MIPSLRRWRLRFPRDRAADPSASAYPWLTSIAGNQYTARVGRHSRAKGVIYAGIEETNGLNEEWIPAAILRGT